MKTAHYGKMLEVAELKTDASRRDIPLTTNIVSVLRKYKLNQRAYLPQVPSNVIPVMDMVFLNEAGNFLDHSNVRKRYARLLESIGLPYIKFHALRHTFATRILEANVHPKVAQELLGHTEASTTMDIYSHVLPNMKREAINKLEGIV